MTVSTSAIFFGIYPRGRFYKYDTKKSWNVADKNPVAIAKAKEQNRAFVTKLAKDELPRLDDYARGFDFRIHSPSAVVQNGKVTANVFLSGNDDSFYNEWKEATIKSALYTKTLQ